jgi:hypothetical protein
MKPIVLASTRTRSAAQMSMPDHPTNNRQSKQRASLALRLDRAAGDLNPILVILMIGLLVLNAAAFVGLAASRHQFASQLVMQLGTENPESAEVTKATPYRTDPLSAGRK